MYIFRMPERVPMLTYDVLAEYIARGRSSDHRKIGTTVTVRWSGFDVEVRLYDTLLATLTGSHVIVGRDLDNHVTNATREWLSLLLFNNGCRPNWVHAEGGKYAVTGQVLAVGTPRPAHWQYCDYKRDGVDTDGTRYWYCQTHGAHEPSRDAHCSRNSNSPAHVH